MSWSCVAAHGNLTQCEEETTFVPIWKEHAKIQYLERTLRRRTMRSCYARMSEIVKYEHTPQRKGCLAMRREKAPQPRINSCLARVVDQLKQRRETCIRVDRTEDVKAPPSSSCDNASRSDGIVERRPDQRRLERLVLGPRKTGSRCFHDRRIDSVDLDESEANRSRLTETMEDLAGRSDHSPIKAVCMIKGALRRGREKSGA